MLTPRDIEIPALDLKRFEPLIGRTRLARLEQTAKSAATTLRGVTVWNVSSTATGGGVAEMLRVLVGYIRGAGIDARWSVISGDPEFFTITKRVHNRLHGFAGDHGELAAPESGHYQGVLAANLVRLLEEIRPGDVVLLHDPQTAGLATPLATRGARIVWRCHVGSEVVNRWTEEAWHFLRPHLESCDAFVWSRAAYVPEWIPTSRVSVIPPSIDPLSPKNEDLPAESVRGILATMGFQDPDGGPGAVPEGRFTRSDGSPGVVRRWATIVSDGPVEDGAPLVVQVSRWDHLKDMQGVLAGFASGVAEASGAHLALVGPQVAGVTDDPEGAQVLQECTVAWEALAPAARRRVHLVSLPTEDGDENAAMVNALQRRATVIVQKSLAEGFGLTVTEGMWKGRPVVASAIGGIVDQIEDGVSGILLADPTDLKAFGERLDDLLARPEEMERLGRKGRRRVLDAFVGDVHLMRFAQLMHRLVSHGPATLGPSE